MSFDSVYTMYPNNILFENICIYENCKYYLHPKINSNYIPSLHRTININKKKTI